METVEQLGNIGDYRTSPGFLCKWQPDGNRDVLANGLKPYREKSRNFGGVGSYGALVIVLLPLPVLE